MRFLALAIGVFVGLGARSGYAQAVRNDRVVTLDFVRAKPGERTRLIRFFQLNWEAARRTALAQGAITGYRLLIQPDTMGVWDVALETEYPDSATHARREQLFQPILRAKGKILIDGLDRPALGDILESHELRVAGASP